MQIRDFLAAIPWATSIPIFLSSFLGLCAGIVLDAWKSNREERRKRQNKLKDEVNAINIAVAALSYNIEACIHITRQNILPHYRDSREANRLAEEFRKEFNEPNQGGMVGYGGLRDGQRSVELKLVTAVNDQHPAMMTSAPELGFDEHDLWEKLSFIIEKEPELLKRSNWATNFAHILRRRLSDRNLRIEAVRARTPNGVTFPHLIIDIHDHFDLAKAECVAVLQLLERIQDMLWILMRLGQSYKHVEKVTVKNS